MFVFSDCLEKRRIFDFHHFYPCYGPVHRFMLPSVPGRTGRKSSLLAFSSLLSVVSIEPHRQVALENGLHVRQSLLLAAAALACDNHGVRLLSSFLCLLFVHVEINVGHGRLACEVAVIDAGVPSWRF